MFIQACSCKNDFQDKKYGPGKRVHNSPIKRNGTMTESFGRCTVCGSEKEKK